MLRPLGTALALVLACDSKPEAEPAKPAEPGPGSVALAAALAPTTAMTGVIALSDAIPSDAFAVAVVRLPGSWLDTFTTFDPFPGSSEDFALLRADLDQITQAHFGLTLGAVRGASAFAIDEETFAAVIDGATGTPKGKAVAPGIVALEGQPDVHAAMVGDQLVLGSPAAVVAAVAAAADASKRLSATPEIAAWLAANTEGAAAMIAVDLTRAPKKLVGGIAGVQRGFAVLGATRLAVAIEGEPTVIAGMATQVDIGMKAALAELQRLEGTMRKSDDVLMHLGAAFTAHQGRRMQKLVKPVVEAGRLSIEVPLDTGNATTLVAVAGLGAAIAIPALTKYMRRSKTSEARVQIAKMFDAASAYFNEEMVPRAGVVALAAHGCPNDGRPSGTAGVTPPLSVDCNAGPGGRCVPTTGGGSDPGAYDTRLWLDNPVWQGLNFQVEQAHYFHYDFKWANGGTGFGNCQFTAQAFGDLDGDGVWSTFERAGAADELGVNAAAGLYIDQEVE